MSQLFNLLSTKTFRRALRKNATPQEVMLWSRLRGDRMPGTKWRRQYSVGPFIADFYLPEKRIVIEIDGSQHYQDGAPEYDARRSKFLQEYGCKVLRFTNTDINTNIGGVVDMIWLAVVGE